MDGGRVLRLRTAAATAGEDLATSLCEVHSSMSKVAGILPPGDSGEYRQAAAGTMGGLYVYCLSSKRPTSPGNAAAAGSRMRSVARGESGVSSGLTSMSEPKRPRARSAQSVM